MQMYMQVSSLHTMYHFVVRDCHTMIPDGIAQSSSFHDGSLSDQEMYISDHYNRIYCGLQIH